MIQKEDQEKLVEEKGKKAQGIWDLDQAGTEKAEHAFSGQFGPQQRSQPA